MRLRAATSVVLRNFVVCLFVQLPLALLAITPAVLSLHDFQTKIMGLHLLPTALALAKTVATFLHRFDVADSYIMLIFQSNNH